MVASLHGKYGIVASLRRDWVSSIVASLCDKLDIVVSIRHESGIVASLCHESGMVAGLIRKLE